MKNIIEKLKSSLCVLVVVFILFALITKNMLIDGRMIEYFVSISIFIMIVLSLVIYDIFIILFEMYKNEK